MRRILFCLAYLYFGTAVFAQDLEPKGKIKDPKTFNDKVHNTLMSKRLKEATQQRDSLFDLTKKYQKDTTERGLQYRALDSTHRYWLAQYDALDKKYNGLLGDYNEMNDKYTQLIKTSLSRTEQLNLALQQKSDELKEREKKLAEMQTMLRKQEMKNGKVYVSMTDKLLFRSGSADIEDKGKEAIKKLADILNKNTEVSITIEGHTDNIPIKTAQFKDNWDLSVARATNMVRLLDETYKVDAKRLTAAGRGEYVPKATNETPEGRAKNRRTEIILSPKLDELYKIVGW